MNMQDLIPLIVGILAAIPGLVSLIYQRRQAEAQEEAVISEAVDLRAGAADRVVESALQLLQPLKDRVADLEKKVDELQMEVDELRLETASKDSEVKRLRAGCMLLINQLRSLGLTPLFQMEDK